MALFFHSHLCNKICKSMGLTAFDLSPAEKGQLDCTSKLLVSEAGTGARAHLVSPTTADGPCIQGPIRL